MGGDPLVVAGRQRVEQMILMGIGGGGGSRGRPVLNEYGRRFPAAARFVATVITDSLVAIYDIAQWPPGPGIEKAPLLFVSQRTYAVDDCA